MSDYNKGVEDAADLVLWAVPDVLCVQAGPIPVTEIGKLLLAVRADIRELSRKDGGEKSCEDYNSCYAAQVFETGPCKMEGEDCFKDCKESEASDE